MKDVLFFVTLNKYQTQFFVETAKRLKNKGYTSIFISFHQRSSELIKNSGFEVFDPFKEGTDCKVHQIEDLFSSYVTRYGIENPDLILSHERAAFRIVDSKKIKSKYIRYFGAIESFFRKFESSKHRATVVQELGGFAANMSTFFVARSHGLDNVFIEPSFYRGRVFFTKNTFQAPKVIRGRHSDLPEVASYIEETLKKSRIVIPSKDKSHYRGITSKILSPYNMKRLIQKTLDKHVLGLEEEFSHISSHVLKHLLMFSSRSALSPYYKQKLTQKYVYYPFHVPADFALTIRSPEHLDQISLVDYIARSLPLGYRLAIKEHPAQVGSLPPARILQLIRKNDNIDLIHPGINNFEIMKNATVVVTVNSKTGAEALLCGKSVVVLGDAFYRDCGSVTTVSEMSGLPSKIRESIANPPDPSKVRKFLEDVWQVSYPGDLFFTEQANCSQFAESLTRYLSESSSVHVKRPSTASDRFANKGQLPSERDAALRLSTLHQN